MSYIIAEGSLSSFKGITWVAVLDIQGFKQFMKEGEGLDVLNKFLADSFQVLGEQRVDRPGIDGYFFSDLGIVYHRALSYENRQDNESDRMAALNQMLQVIKALNRAYITPSSEWGNVPFLTKCAICFGDFSFQQKIEHAHIRKGAVYGGAYVEAYQSVDDKDEKTAMEAGEVRILMNHMDFSKANELRVYFDRFKELSEYSHLYRYTANHAHYSWTFSKDPFATITSIRRRCQADIKERKQAMFTQIKSKYIEWIKEPSVKPILRKPLDIKDLMNKKLKKDE